jgi:hypothetical protein
MTSKKVLPEEASLRSQKSEVNAEKGEPFGRDSGAAKGKLRLNDNELLFAVPGGESDGMCKTRSSISIWWRQATIYHE